MDQSKLSLLKKDGKVFKTDITWMAEEMVALRLQEESFNLIPLLPRKRGGYQI